MRRLIPVLAALATVSVASGEMVYDNGPPNYAYGNELTQWTQAEDFEVAEDVILSGASFSMFTYDAMNSWDGTLDWWIYEDTGGLPGTLLASGAAQNVDVAFDQQVGSWDFYGFTFEFAGEGVAVNAGSVYWLALHAASDWVHKDDLYWSASDANATYLGHEQLNGVGAWNPTEDQHSFQLNVIPGPGALALLGLAGLATRCRRR